MSIRPVLILGWCLWRRGSRGWCERRCCERGSRELGSLGSYLQNAVPRLVIPATSVAVVESVPLLRESTVSRGIRRSALVGDREQLSRVEDAARVEDALDVALQVDLV